MTSEGPRLAKPVEQEAPAPPLIRNRDFQALWMSRCFSGLGRESGEVAYPLLVLLVIGSATYAGTIGAAQVVTAMLMSVVGGMLADRINRRMILLRCDLARFLLLAAFTVLLLTGSVGTPLILCTAIASAAFLGVSNPVAMAAIKQLVPASQVSSAAARNQVRFFTTTAIGPPIAGSLFDVGRAFPSCHSWHSRSGSSASG